MSFLPMYKVEEIVHAYSRPRKGDEVYLAALVVLDTSLTCVPFLLPLFARDSEAHPSSAGCAAFSRAPLRASSQAAASKKEPRSLATHVSLGYDREVRCVLSRNR